MSVSISERARALRDETVAHRRFFHTHAEVGLDMPLARAYITEQLRAIGVEPQTCGSGILATIGSGGKCILLRADMDALAMPEESGEPFACPTGTEAHACGHDFHAAMLLTAAKILKEREASLPGTVKLMFQPAEEPLLGNRDMLAAGALDAPSVDAALAIHVTTGHTQVGTFLYNDSGPMMFSANSFRFTIRGRGTHGAYPQQGVDPINAGVHLHLAFQSLIAREADPEKATVFTIGKFQAGAVGNIIPDTAVLEGSLRCNDPGEQTRMLQRIQETARGVADTFGVQVETELLSDVPPLVCNGELTRQIVHTVAGLDFPDLHAVPGIQASASEDFALTAARVPACFLYFCAGFPDERGDYPAHNPKVRFHEGVCPLGAAAYAAAAVDYLEKN